MEVARDSILLPRVIFILLITILKAWCHRTWISVIVGISVQLTFYSFFLLSFNYFFLHYLSSPFSSSPSSRYSAPMRFFITQFLLLVVVGSTFALPIRNPESSTLSLDKRAPKDANSLLPTHPADPNGNQPSFSTTLITRDLGSGDGSLQKRGGVASFLKVSL
jgi:hypothetical protein